jgi:uncharacterized protein
LKLHADSPTHLNAVTAYGPGFVQINQVRHAASVVVAPDGVTPWSIDHFDAFEPDAVPLPAGCEVLLIGTGERQRFAPPRLLRNWHAARFGFEFMDTAAACRTYNILMGEGRRVVAALIVEKAR